MKRLILSSVLFLSVSYLTPVTAVTDAELEALEKQIEQQETEDLKQAEDEAKRKAEAEAKKKAKAEAKNKVYEEQKRQAELKKQWQEEQKKKEEEKLKQRKEQRKTEVAQRLKVKFQNGEWIFDDNTGCAGWNSFPDGIERISWSGDCVDGMVSGNGIFQWFLNGEKSKRIEGEFKAGTSDGYGVEYYTNGDRYQGQIKDGYRNGHGLYIWADGDRWDGKWKDNEQIKN